MDRKLRLGTRCKASSTFRFPSGYTRPLLSSVPYFHVVDGKRVYVADQLGSPPVQPGDTIKLMSGDYGDIVIGDYLQQVVNPSFVTVEAAPGQTPVFSTLFIRSTKKWVFKGIKVQSLFGTNNNKLPLVAVTDQGAALPTSDIILENMQVSSADNTDGWTQPEWLARARVVGISAKGTDHGANTTCVSVTNSHISNVIFGSEVMANNMLFSGNEIDRFGDDGIDYVASNISDRKELHSRRPGARERRAYGRHARISWRSPATSLSIATGSSVRPIRNCHSPPICKGSTPSMEIGRTSR